MERVSARFPPLLVLYYFFVPQSLRFTVLFSFCLLFFLLCSTASLIFSERRRSLKVVQERRTEDVVQKKKEKKSCTPGDKYMVRRCEVASQSLNATLIWEAASSTPTVRSGQWRAEETSSAARLPEAETDAPLVSHLIFPLFDVSCFLLLGSFRG